MSGEIKAKTKHGEMTIDQLAEIQPGMAKIMQAIAHDYSYAYHAAKGGNWKLTAHELSLVRAEFRTAKVTRPKYAEDLDAFDAECLVPILKAIQNEDKGACEEAFEKGIEGSDKYHEKRGCSYIKFILPKEPPADLHLGPTESFSREKVKAGGAPSRASF
jgi:hypothetical protein